MNRLLLIFFAIVCFNLSGCVFFTPYVYSGGARLNEDNEVCLFIPLSESKGKDTFEVRGWSVFNRDRQVYESEVLKVSPVELHSNYIVHSEECIHSGFKIEKGKDGRYSYDISTLDENNIIRMWGGDFTVHINQPGIITLSDNK